MPNKSPNNLAGAKKPLQGSVSPTKGTGRNMKKKSETEPVQEPNEFIGALKESGLQGVIHAFKNGESVVEEASYLLLNFAKFNAVELFTDKLLQ